MGKKENKEQWVGEHYANNIIVAKLVPPTIMIGEYNGTEINQSDVCDAYDLLINCKYAYFKVSAVSKADLLDLRNNIDEILIKK